MTLERQWIKTLQERLPETDLRHDTFYDAPTRQIVTTDMLVEGVHFDWQYFSPEDIGWRAVAVNLSDIAATGGSPHWVTVSIGIPSSSDSLARLEQIFSGIQLCCEAYLCRVVGGDTVHSPNTVINVTAIGSLAPMSQPGRRNQAKEGDVIAISGPHGFSRAGLEALKNGLEGHKRFKQAHLRPAPRLKLGQKLASVLPHVAIMDSSDGLADAVLRMSEASNVDIVLDASRIELHPKLEALAQETQNDPWDWVLYGGEDFELVVSLPPETVVLFPELQPIGWVKAASDPSHPKAHFKQGDRVIELMDSKTFQHFNNSMLETPLL